MNNRTVRTQHAAARHRWGPGSPRPRPPSAARQTARQAQGVRWGDGAIYRVQVRMQPQAYCGVSVCYEALLLDAAP